MIRHYSNLAELDATNEVSVPLDINTLKGTFAPDGTWYDVRLQSETGQIVYFDDIDSHGVMRPFGEGREFWSYKMLLNGARNHG